MNRPHWSYPLYRLGWSGLDWLFPPKCGGCGKVGSRWCESCQNKVPALKGTLCEVCGLPQKEQGTCARCRLSPPSFRALRSWAAFDFPIRPALHNLKYRRDMGLGDALAVPLADFVTRLDWPFDAIVPVPLGRRRMQERGYNQVALVTHPLSLAIGRNHWPHALQRKRETRSQVGLSATERRENVDDAFVADPKLAQGKIFLVVDDVATTGSTLSSCAEALLQAGAKDVFAMTVGRALPHHGLDQV